MKYNFWHETLPESPLEKRSKLDPLFLLRRAAEEPRDGITVGEDVATGLDIRLSPKQNLATHMHICGSTGVGKSYFMEGILKHLIRAGHGVCVITPHDEIYRRLVSYCAYLEMTRPELGLGRRVIPFDIDDTRRVIGFNPVARNARVLTYQVIALMEAIRKCWGTDTFQQTPRLARWLYNTGFAVVEPGLTMLQAQRLVDNKPHPLREAIVRQIQHPDIRAEWEWIMSPKHQWPGKDDPLESSFNRIREFTSNELIRHMLGQYTRTLDVPAVLRERKILLVNLDARNAMGEDNRHLLGTLLVNEIMAAAFARKEGKRTPFFLAIDEFQHFATKDVCEILDGGRKYGLHLILAHQLLHQLQEKNPEVYFSTMTNARTKVVFGGLMDEDVELLAKELYVGELDPDEIKHEIWQTKYEPVETTRIVVTESEGETESDSYSEISHQSLMQSESFIADSGFFHSYPQSVTAAAGGGHAQGNAHGSSWSSSRSESLVPFYEYHEYKELSGVTFRSLDEQLYLKKAQLKRQPRQHAALLIPGRNVQLMRTPDLRDFRVSDRHVDEFKHACWEAAGCFARPEDAEAEIRALETRLLAPSVIDVKASVDDDGDSDVD
jgi:hypothetical protein